MKNEGYKTYTYYFSVKPVILLERTHVYEKGMIINCSLTKSVVNPPQVNYTWYSCGTSTCDDKNLKLISESYSLRLESQSNTRMNYRCKVNNAAGSAYQDIVVVIVSEKLCESKDVNVTFLMIKHATRADIKDINLKDEKQVQVRMFIHSPYPRPKCVMFTGAFHLHGLTKETNKILVWPGFNIQVEYQ